jgi:adenylosuccinate lyase
MRRVDSGIRRGELLVLMRKGMSREEAYAAVQRNAMAAWEGKGSFADFLAADPAIAQHLKSAEIKALFGLDHHLRHVDTIFKRAFGA